MGLPIVGAFVVLSINPIATLESLVDDEELLAACKEMENKRYVAYVGESLQFYNPLVPYRSYDFYFISQGLPSEDELADGQDLQMSIPVLPNTGRLSSRPPLNPTLPLPWDDCYLSIFCSVEARASTEVVPHDNMPEWMLDPKETARMYGLLSDDRRRRRELYAIKYPDQEAPALHASHLIQEPFEHDTAADDSGSSYCSSDSDSESDDSDMESEIDSVQEITADFLAAIPNNAMPVVDTDEELAAVEKPSNPKDFFKEIEHLNKLVADYKVRKLRQIEEARICDDQHYADTVKPASIPGSPTHLNPPNINSIDDAAEQQKLVEAAAAVTQLTDTSRPDYENTPPIPESPKALVASSVDVIATSDKPSQVREEYHRPGTPVANSERRAVSMPMESPQQSVEPDSPLREGTQTVKRLPIARLWRKSRQVVQGLVPSKLAAKLSAIRQRGSAGLNRSFGRLKSYRKPTAPPDSDIPA